MSDLGFTYDTVVIGGGLSGMAAALRRNKRGDKVLLLEKNQKLGGKLDELKWNNFRWDKGPSLFTLPHLVDELFELYGKDPRQYFQYELHHENCRYYYQDGTKFILQTDENQRRLELSQIFSDREANAVEDYLIKAASTYNAIGDLFIDEPKLQWKDALKPKVLKQYPKVLSSQMLRNLNRFNEGKLKHPKLVQLFNRFGTYNGSNPYKMSGLYSMIPHLELNLGTYFPKGGMRSIVDGIENLISETDIEIRLDQQQIRVEAKNGGFLINSNGRSILSKRVICAIDHVTFYRKIFRDNKQLNRSLVEERSSSGLVFYWAIDQKFNEIGLHNILFSEDYKKEFDQIFGGQIPENPTIYIHNSSAIEPSDAPENGQNWFVMINTPAGVQPTEKQIGQLRSFIVDRVRQFVGIEIENKILFEDHWTMKDIESITGSYQGALYGGAFNSKMASFKRHGNQSKKHKGLFFTGGSVHPGGGIPLVLKSAKIVDQLIEEHG
ncbi:MAG: NAD(P)/FAD-dependent oxidoreductase [Crocinitomicaceae bacterium]